MISAYISTPCSNTFWLFCNNIVRIGANIFRSDSVRMLSNILLILGVLLGVGYGISLVVGARI